MKKRILIALAIIGLGLFIVSCDDNPTYVHGDYYPPRVTGLVSITGDQAVQLLWDPIYLDDISYYKIWYAPQDADPSDPHEYTYIADVSASHADWTDYDVENGTTYYYVVTAVNDAGYESEMSDYVMDTPRPEGHDVTIYDYHDASHVDRSGYDLYEHIRVPYDTVTCDFYADYDTDYDLFFITVRFDDYYIQDFGYASNFDDIGYAPPEGWSSFYGIEAIEGHMYILKLYHFDRFHYAKVWITDLDPVDGTMRFSWAYQTDPENRELKVVPGNQVLKKDISAAN